MSYSSPLRRVLRSLFSLVLGIIVGTTTSLYHSVLFPWGLAVSLILIGLAIAAMRILFWERYPSGWTSVGIIGSLIMLAGVDGNGSVLIVADVAGLVLLGGATILVVGGLAWPRFPPRVTHYDEEQDSFERARQQ
ncbi:MAG: hypothetical protein ACPG20_04475 [Pontimonas sp.]